MSYVLHVDIEQTEFCVSGMEFKNNSFSQFL